MKRAAVATKKARITRDNIKKAISPDYISKQEIDNLIIGALINRKKLPKIVGALFYNKFDLSPVRTAPYIVENINFNNFTLFLSQNSDLAESFEIKGSEILAIMKSSLISHICNDFDYCSYRNTKFYDKIRSLILNLLTLNADKFFSSIGANNSSALAIILIALLELILSNLDDICECDNL